MRKFVYIPLLIVFISHLVSSCSGNDEPNYSSGTTVTNYTRVYNTASSGTWRVTLYNDSGTIKTSDFTGYTFTFGSGNVLTATYGVNTYLGTWSVTDFNSDYDSLEDLNFNIAFSAPASFAAITNDWQIVTRTDTKIALQDLSGGNGTTDLLTLEKN